MYHQVDLFYTIALGLTIESERFDLFKIRLEKLESSYASFIKCNYAIVKLRAMLDSTSKAEDLTET